VFAPEAGFTAGFTYLKLSVCPGALGVHNTFWNTFTIEVCEKINQMEILE
jgi:hypothetical protein